MHPSSERDRTRTRQSHSDRLSSRDVRAHVGATTHPRGWFDRELGGRARDQSVAKHWEDISVVDDVGRRGGCYIHCHHPNLEYICRTPALWDHHVHLSIRLGHTM